MIKPAETPLLIQQWRSQLRAVCGDLEVSPSKQHSLFIGDVRRQELDGLEIAQVRTNAGMIVRDRRCLSNSDDRYCFLVFQRSGAQSIRQGGLHLELAAGDIALIDSAAPFEILPHGLIENTSVHLARGEARRLMGPHALFGKLSASSNAAHILSSLVQPIHDACSLYQSVPGEGRALQEALIALLVPAFKLGGCAMPRVADCCESSELYALSLRIIESSLQDSDLDPETLAGRLGVSLRRLYRLYESEGDSVCRVIQRRRLQRSAEDLRHVGESGESITQIAFKWGFFDTSHFSRAFKREFGLSPREYRLLNAEGELWQKNPKKNGALSQVS